MSDLIVSDKLINTFTGDTSITLVIISPDK